MKQSFKDVMSKSVKELEKQVRDMKNELAKMHMDAAVNPQKDTNIAAKKKKQLAVIMTALHAKKMEAVATK